MYYPKKTRTFISSFCFGAVALGGASIAFAQTGSLDQHLDHGALNNADVQIVANENTFRRIERPEAWRTPTGKATARRLGGNRNDSTTRGETEGVKGGEDYDVSSDQPENSDSSAEQAGIDDSRSDRETQSSPGGSGSAQQHESPRSHIHAGPHGK